MIKPTIGRVVWFTPAKNSVHTDFKDRGDQPCAALVAYVHDDKMLNLTVSDHDGVTHSKSHVPLIQEGDERPEGYYAEWMPYQKGQAAKTESLEKQVAGA